MSSSGKFSGGRRSNFARTCNLLSRFVKEKGSLRDLNLEIGGKVESLQEIVKLGSSLAESNTGKSTRLASLEKQTTVDSSIANVEDDSYTASTKAQLTIFYAGKVLVFDDYPAAKMKCLVSIAKKNSSRTSYGILSTNHAASGLPPRSRTGGSKQRVGISSNTFREKTNFKRSRSGEKLSPESGFGSDLPIVRRPSLDKFLEKRNDRVGVKGSYYNQDQAGLYSMDKGDGELDLNLVPQVA